MSGRPAGTWPPRLRWELLGAGVSYSKRWGRFSGRTAPPPRPPGPSVQPFSHAASALLPACHWVPPAPNPGCRVGDEEAGLGSSFRVREGAWPPPPPRRTPGKTEACGGTGSAAGLLSSGGSSGPGAGGDAGLWDRAAGARAGTCASREGGRGAGPAGLARTCSPESAAGPSPVRQAGVMAACQGLAQGSHQPVPLAGTPQDAQGPPFPKGAQSCSRLHPVPLTPDTGLEPGPHLLPGAPQPPTWP